MTYDLSCDLLRLSTRRWPTVSTSEPRAGAGVDGTSLVFYRQMGQYFCVSRLLIWRMYMSSGCEVVTVDQRRMTEVPCVRLGLESPMPPMLSRWRTVADLSSLSQHHQHQHHPAPPSDNTHRDTYAPFACTRRAHAVHAAQEGIEEGDTYHQLDLLGRAAVGVGGCRVVGFALAAGVHGGRAPEWVDCKDIWAATAVWGSRTICDRGARAFVF